MIYSAALQPYFAHERRASEPRSIFMTDFTFALFMRSAQEGILPERHRDAWFAGVCASNWHVRLVRHHWHHRRELCRRSGA